MPLPDETVVDRDFVRRVFDAQVTFAGR